MGVSVAYSLEWHRPQCLHAISHHGNWHRCVTGQGGSGLCLSVCSALQGRPGLLRTVLEAQETRGLTRSDDISRLLPSEAANMARGRRVRQSKLLFFAKARLVFLSLAMACPAFCRPMSSSTSKNGTAADGVILPIS